MNANNKSTTRVRIGTTFELCGQTYRIAERQHRAGEGVMYVVERQVEGTWVRTEARTRATVLKALSA